MSEHERRKDRLLQVVAVVGVFIALGMTTAVIYYGPKLVDANDNTAATKQNTELTSCRAQYNASVTAATSQLLADGFRASLDRTEENVHIVNLDIGVVDAANKAYQAAVDLAAGDPDAFLEQCRTNPPK